MQTHYVDPSLKIQAALATPEMRTVTYALCAAGVPKITEPVRLVDLDEHLKCSRLTVTERIAAKNCDEPRWAVGLTTRMAVGVGLTPSVIAGCGVASISNAAAGLHAAFERAK